MTRTYIIDADGTRFVPHTEARRRRNKIFGIVCLILASPFFLAAMVGIYLGATGQAMPSDLHATPTAQGTSAVNLDTAKKACKKAPRGSMSNCLALYTRSAWYTKNTSTPAGKVLVKECFSEYRGQELRDCLRQPLA